MKLFLKTFIAILGLSLIDTQIQAQQGVLWSILIPTLEERKESFEYLYNKIQNQINNLGLQDKVVIEFFKDDREYHTGYKRQWLLEHAKGKYVCFFDDDDDCSDNYVEVIYKALLTNPDVVELRGIMTVDGKNPKLFIHSIKYQSWFERAGIYYRCPNHLNPVRRSYARKFRYIDASFGEDLDWSMQIQRSGLLKKEAPVKEPYYFYLAKSHKAPAGPRRI